MEFIKQLRESTSLSGKEEFINMIGFFKWWGIEAQNEFIKTCLPPPHLAHLQPYKEIYEIMRDKLNLSVRITTSTNYGRNPMLTYPSHENIIVL